MSLQHSPQPRFQRGRHLPLKLGPAETVLSSSWGALPRAKALRRVFIRGQEWKIHHAQGRKFHSEGPLSCIIAARPIARARQVPFVCLRTTGCFYPALPMFISGDIYHQNKNKVQAALPPVQRPRNPSLWHFWFSPT